MSSYVDSVLAEGERIVYRAHVSRWKFFLSYLVGGLFLAAAVATYVAGSRYTAESATLAAILFAIGLVVLFSADLFAIGLVVLFSAVVRRWTTELVLTNRRIITKR